MDDKISFEDIKGVEVIKHKKGRSDAGDRACFVGAGIMALLSFITVVILLIVQLCVGDGLFVGGEWGKMALGLAVVGLLCAILCGLSLPRFSPERYTLRFTNELSALDLKQIEEQYDLKRGAEPDIWVATPRAKWAFYELRGGGECAKEDDGDGR